MNEMLGLAAFFALVWLLLSRIKRDQVAPDAEQLNTKSSTRHPLRKGYARPPDPTARAQAVTAGNEGK